MGKASQDEITKPSKIPTCCNFPWDFFWDSGGLSHVDQRKSVCGAFATTWFVISSILFNLVCFSGVFFSKQVVIFFLKILKITYRFSDVVLFIYFF